MEIKFYENNLYTGLDLENDNTGSSIEATAILEGFKKQNKRHITILYYPADKIFENIPNNSPVEVKEKIIKEINELLKSFEWKFKPTEIYKIEKQGYFRDSSILEHRESYINLVEMPDIEIFYKKLNLLLKSNLPVQFTHITLFTKGERKDASFYGIPIPYVEEFNNLNPRKISKLESNERFKEIKKILIGSLKESYQTHEQLAEKGEKYTHTINSSGDRTLVIDYEIEETIINFFKKLNFPIKIISEEHGEVNNINRNPKYLGVLDGLDGSRVYKTERGIGRYGTMFGIFDTLNPKYNDYLASGIMEHSTNKLYFSIKNNGSFVIEKDKEPVQIKSSGQTKLSKSNKIWIDEELMKEPFNNKDLEKTRDILKSHGFEINISKGSSAIDYVDLAIGEKDIVLECTRKNNLEIAVAYGLVKESGGVIVDLNGDDLGDKKYKEFGQKDHVMVITASTPELVSEMINLLKK
ncbi:MAG: inositol monophosphatase family protein [Candidatus Paceibacterota bacterium]